MSVHSNTEIIYIVFTVLVESYMHMFGTEHVLSDFHPVESTNSKQFYLHMQERYQLELFHSQAAIADPRTLTHFPNTADIGMQMSIHPAVMMDNSVQSPIVRLLLSLLDVILLYHEWIKLQAVNLYPV